MINQSFIGSHYDIGFKLGSKLRFMRINFDKIINLNEFQKDFGKKSQEILLDVFPEICEEIRGITDGLKFSHERFASWLLCMACCLFNEGCTAIGFRHNGKVIYGRNGDLPPEMKKVCQSFYYKLENGMEFIGNSSAMINFEEGYNNNGLAVGMTFVFPADIKPGLSAVFLVRYLLEKCGTTAEAVEELKKIPVASACNILLADLKGDIVVAECAPEKMVVRTAEADDFIVATNHFVSDEMLEYSDIEKNNFHADRRYKTAYETLKNKQGKDAVEYAKEILGGRYGFICQYEEELDFDTLWSTVIDITENKIYRAEGNPSVKKFIQDKRLSGR